MYLKMKAAKSRGDEEKFCPHLPKQYSRLYLAIADKLSAVICIEDPLRKEAADVIATLHDRGFSRIVMMTGDSKHTAQPLPKPSA